MASLIYHVESDWLYLDRVQTLEATNDHHPPVELSRTRTSFGAERIWFLCPTCGKRVRKLYLPPGAFHFRCRSCHKLTYASRQKRSWSPKVEMRRARSWRN